MLSTLWKFALFNVIFRDIHEIFRPGFLEEVLTGSINGLQMTEGFLLLAALLLEIPIAMVILSRVLKYRANRWANIIAGIIKTAAVLLSMFVGTPAMYYVFFGTIEIATTLLIVWLAWNWRNPKA